MKTVACDARTTVPPRPTAGNRCRPDAASERILRAMTLLSITVRRSYVIARAERRFTLVSFLVRSRDSVARRATRALLPRPSAAPLSHAPRDGCASHRWLQVQHPARTAVRPLFLEPRSAKSAIAGATFAVGSRRDVRSVCAPFARRFFRHDGCVPSRTPFASPRLHRRPARSR